MGDSAESLLRALLHQPTAFEPLLLLALALYAQHKPHQACQTLLDALRLAQPERFVRPFLDHAGRLCGWCATGAPIRKSADG